MGTSEPMPGTFCPFPNVEPPLRCPENSRGGPDMAKRLVVLVVVLAFLGGGLAVVSLTGSDESEIIPREARALRKLPLGAGGAAESATAARRDAAGAEPAHDMALPAPS